jgi:hypothetical protein
MAQFPASFHTLLMKGAKKQMTTQEGLDIFMNTIKKSKPTTSMAGGYVYVFQLPAEIRHAPNRADLLLTIQDNLELPGFHQRKDFMDISTMKTGTFFFSGTPMHDCMRNNCKREGCPTCLCDYNYGQCTTLTLCSAVPLHN